MNAFRFRLDRVLDWYQKRTQFEETRLAACLTALAEIHEAIARLEAERLGIERDLIARQAIPAQDLAALVFYRLRARRQGLELGVEKDTRNRAVNDQRARLQAVQRRLRLLEKLRERRQAEHRYAADRELENLAADAYLSRWPSH